MLSELNPRQLAEDVLKIFIRIKAICLRAFKEFAEMLSFMDDRARLGPAWRVGKQQVLRPVTKGLIERSAQLLQAPGARPS